MTTTTAFVDDVLQRLHGFGLAQDRASFLTTSVDTDDTTLYVSDATGFDQGVAEIGDELVFVDLVDASNGTITLSPDGRGYYGTTAAAHAVGTRLTMAPTWSRQQVLQATNDAILAVYPTLFAVGSTSFAFSPVETTYELPADADRVLAVTTDTIGPSKEQVGLNHWSFNSNAPTDVFATGNTVTLERGGFPGRNITVTYLKQPTEITSDGEFTDSGLAESARVAIRYSVLSLLTADMDAARLPVDTAQADALDPSKNGIGSAARVSTQYLQRYQVELEAERRRQRLSTKLPINFRTR